MEIPDIQWIYGFVHVYPPTTLAGKVQTVRREWAEYRKGGRGKGVGGRLVLNCHARGGALVSPATQLSHLQGCSVHVPPGTRPTTSRLPPRPAVDARSHSMRLDYGGWASLTFRLLFFPSFYCSYFISTNCNEFTKFHAIRNFRESQNA